MEAAVQAAGQSVTGAEESGVGPRSPARLEIRCGVRWESNLSQRQGAPRTSADEADGAEQACLCVVHLQWQELPSEGKDEVCEGPEAGIVHLSPVQGQPIGEGHSVLLWGVPCADPQHLEVGGGLVLSLGRSAQVGGKRA